MAHAIGSATISFGLVSIPVKLHTTSQSSDSISFNLLHDECHSRLKQQYICSKDGDIVERSSMVKGYEFAKNQYVIFTEEELKAIEQKASESIDIVHFVPSSTIDPIYFDKAYYLSPSKGGERAYALLAAAIKESGKWAVARYAARGKHFVVALRAYEDALLMQQLHYASAIKPLAELEIGHHEVKQQELKMALQLTEFGSEEAYDPKEFKDESKERMRALIEQKMQGQQITMEAPAEAPGQLIDLMEALRASLEKAPKRKAAAGSSTVAKIPIKGSRDRKPAQPAPVKKATRARSAK